MFTEDRARIAHLEDQVKTLSTPDQRIAQCAKYGERVAALLPSHTDLGRRSGINAESDTPYRDPQVDFLEKLMQALGCNSVRPAQPP
jgi:hypothetical protein